MSDIEHDHYVLGVIDLVQRPPVSGDAGAEYAGELFAEGLANTMGFVQ